MELKYLCPICNSDMYDVTTIQEQTEKVYKCFHCGYMSRSIRSDSPKVTLPRILWSRENMKEVIPIKKIKIKYLRNILPIEIKDGSDWIDLRCAVRTELKAGQYAQIPLGIAMELPDGYEAWVAPRSSTFKKYGVLLSNSLGVIDNSYCGDNDEIHFLAYATQDAVIEVNERICQFRIMKNQPKIDLVTVDRLGNPDRNGIGSTGRV